MEVFDALDGDLDRLCELSFDVFATPERLRALERLERVARRLRTPQHALINQLEEQAGQAELGGTLRCALADRLRITKAEASRRIGEAADLGPRRALTGEPLAPQLSATAAAQRDGLIGDGHIKEIRHFFAHLPAAIDLGTREAAEADLAGKARECRPDELADYAQLIMLLLHPDGDFSDEERARKRGIVLGSQQFDGMSRVSGMVTQELRAAIEAMLAKLAAPGACNPDDETPVVDATPDEDAVRRDHRSAAQRNHDGLLAGLRALIASGKLGQHHGLPVSIVVTTTLQDLEAATGKAITGGGTLVPMSDVLRMGQPRPPLFGDLRSRQTPGALSHQTPGLARAANHALRQGTRMHETALQRPVLQQPGPPRERLDQNPPHRHRRPHPGLRTRQPTRRPR